MKSLMATPVLGGPIAAEWRAWGPYLSERQWGTVREDYSESGTAWDYFPHDQARSRAYRWGEDGLLGISDEKQRLCFALALWNGVDPILKERLFGLTGNEGNHGEDVKEYYWYLDATPTHSYLRGRYKYPQRAFPYADLLAENRRRGRERPEYELIDTGVFAEDRYFDVEVEYAKVAPDDVLIRITATNRGPDSAPLHLLPTLWFRNTWSWGDDDRRPELRACRVRRGQNRYQDSWWSARAGQPPRLGDYWLVYQGTPELLFTENESNAQRLWNAPNRTPYVKDGIGTAVVEGHSDTVNPAGVGTKGAAHYRFQIAPELPRQSLAVIERAPCRPLQRRREDLRDRIAEADAFYAALAEDRLTEDEARVQRQALAGLIWSKQVFNFDVAQWLDGDPAGPPPPESRKHGRKAAGGTTTAVTSSRCRTNGSTPGMRPGTWLSIASPSVWSTPALPKSNSCSCCESGTCTRTAKSPPTNGLPATSIPPFTSWRRGRSIRKSNGAPVKGIVISWPGSSTSSCSTSPGG